MIGILADAHGNIAAFRSAISHLHRLGADRFYFLGDALGYIPTTAVLKELMDMGNAVKCLKGNHECMVLSGQTDPRCDVVYQHQAIRKKLIKNLRDFETQWPTHRREFLAGLNLLFVHGSPNDFTNEYVYPDTDLAKFHVKEDFVFMGHSHYPFVKQWNGSTFVNVGSCGLPRDDGRYGSFSTFDPHTRQVTLYRYTIDGSLTALPMVIREQIHLSVCQIFERRTEALFGHVLPPRGVNS